MEFTINEKPDEPYTSSYRRGYEQLLRKLLRLPSRPAVLQVRDGRGVDGERLAAGPARQQLTAEAVVRL